MITVLLFMLCSFSISSCQVSDWRYESDESCFTNKDNIQLKYTGLGSFNNWEVDSSACDVENPNNPEALLHCNLPGIYSVKALVDGVSTSKYIKFEEEVGSYSWYISTEFIQYFDENRQANSQQSSGFHVSNEGMKPSHYSAGASVWIVDPDNADQSELKLTATIPSQHSTAVTKQFHRLGQEPVFSFLSGGLHSHYSNSTLLGFDSYNGTWNYRLHIETFHQPHYMISGHLISLYGCTVRDTHVFLPRPTFDQPLSNTGVKLVGSVAMDYPEIIQDPCMNNAAVIVSSDGLYLTEDGFITSVLLQIFLFTTGMSEIQVKNAAFTSSHLILHVDNSLYAINRKTGTASVIAGFDASNVLGLKNRDWCSEGVHAGVQNDAFVVYTASEILIADSIESGFTTKTPDAGLFPTISSPAIRITDASFSPALGSVGVAAVVTGGAQDMTAVMRYHIFTDSWHLLSSWDIADNLKNYFLTFENLGSNRFIVWSSDEAYSANVPDLLPIELYSGGSFINGGEEIKQLVMSTDGRMVFGLSSGIFGFGRTTLEKVVRLSSGSPSAASLCGWFDDGNRLYILELDVDGKPGRRIYPLDSELVAALYPDTLCPYSALESSFPADEPHRCVHLDQGESLEMWVSLTYPTSQHPGGDNLEVSIQGEDNLLTVDLNTNVIVKGDLTLENKTIVLKQEYANGFDINAVTTGFSDEAGLVSVEAKPSTRHLFCETSSIKTHISVGCFHSRHIKVQGSSESCDTFSSSYMYTILKHQIEDFSGAESTVDKLVEYDFENLGCPLRVHYHSVYIPEILLYSDDQFVLPVGVKFVIWEENGRKLAYNSTMYDVGCRQKSQTWSDMVGLATPGSPLSAVWGPQNFEDCFTNSSSMNDEVVKELKSSQYPVLNSTGYNGLVFSEEWDGLYILNVKIVDPNYSYCDHQARFAVEVYGVVKEELSQALVTTLAVFVSIIIILLLFSYFFFRIHIYNRPDLDESNDLDESGDSEADAEAIPVIKMSHQS